MKIVITGALGHIGSRVIRELPSDFPKAEIVMLDNLATQRYCSLFNLPAEGNYRFIETDVLKADLNAIVESADVVVHLAAITDAASSFKHKEHVENINKIIEELAKRIKKERDILELWIKLRENGDTSQFIDNPGKWSSKEWDHYLNRQRRLTDEAILQVRKM